MTDLLQFKINVPKSRRQHHCTSQLVCEDRMLLVCVHLHILFAGSNISDASEQFISNIQISFAHFAFLQLHKQKSNGVQVARFKSLSLGTHSAIHTCSLKFFFAQFLSRTECSNDTIQICHLELIIRLCTKM